MIVNMHLSTFQPKLRNGYAYLKKISYFDKSFAGTGGGAQNGRRLLISNQRTHSLCKFLISISK